MPRSVAHGPAGNGAAERIERVVRGVAAAALKESGAPGIHVQEDWTPEGELLYEWLVRELGEEVVWRQAEERVGDERALIAHPLNRTALLLGGPPPLADLLPLGDVYASQVLALTGAWSAPAAVETLAAAAGGVAVLDAALGRWIDERQDAAAALAALGDDVVRQVEQLFDRGRYFRVRPRIVPKLGPRTLGVDLWD